MDIFWLRHEILTDLENLAEPDLIAGGIIEGLGAALEGFQTMLEEL